MKNLSKRIVSLLCILVLLCAALPVLADQAVPEQKLTFQSTNKSRYINLIDYYTPIDCKAAEPTLEYDVTLLNSNPAEDGIRVSDNCILYIPAYLAGTAVVKMDVSYISETLITVDTVKFNITVNPRPANIRSIRSTKKGIVDLKWNALYNADYYTVYYSKTADMKNASKLKTEDNSCSVKKLKAGETYYFFVAACVELDKGVVMTSPINTKMVKAAVVYPQCLVESFMVVINGRYGNQDARIVTVRLGRTLSVEAVNFKPFYATKKSVVWESSDEDVAVITRSGDIITLDRGSTLITATSVDGNAFCSFTLNVK